MTSTATTPVTLVNIFSVEPAKQQKLLDLLRHNTETVIKTLKGWIATSLIPSIDGQRVVIYSQWESAADIEAMREDPRMMAYFPEVSQLMTSIELTIGTVAVAHQRR